MDRVSASASRSLPSQDLRRYSYKLSYTGGQDGKQAPPNPCRCALPERPDNWSDAMWRKYLAAMARLPCKLCKTEPVAYPLPTRSSVPQGSTTSIMRLLSKGKKHYKENKKEQQQQTPHDGESDATAEALCSTPFCATNTPSSSVAEATTAAPFCATNTPSSAVEAISAAAVVFPRRKKGAAPWEEE